jgi:SAM-dependent methyltransferase
MDLRELQKHWDAFGREDPLWAILALPEKRFGIWDVEEFFSCGQRQIEGLFKELDERGIARPTGKALDFGCGVGRLTQALCAHFEECCGVDIAPSMIEHARRLNRFGDRCRYFLNERDDLSLFPDGEFNFICSIIVLQHMRPEYIRCYLKEFLRVLAPGGLAVFQIPGGPVPTGVIEEASSRLAAGPLPESAYRAGLTLVAPPTRLTADAQAELTVRVRNLGDTVWPACGLPDGRFWIRLGNHWLDGRKGLLILDDARAVLPNDLGSGEEADLQLVITAPRNSGLYHLEVDRVQESVTWFKDRGSTSAIGKVLVQAPAEPVAKADAFVPVMEMHSIPKYAVVALLASHGATVIDVQRVNVGSSLLDYSYYVMK